MTLQELISVLKNRGASFAPACSIGQINLVNINLQRIHAATLSTPMANLYQTCGGIWMGSGYIFGPQENTYNNKHPIPDIFNINRDLTNLPNMRGKTLFGRNDLFWFVFDAFGNCAMVDNLNLNVLRKYTDPYQAVYECLVGGKI